MQLFNILNLDKTKLIPEWGEKKELDSNFLLFFKAVRFLLTSLYQRSLHKQDNLFVYNFTYSTLKEGQNLSTLT